MNAPKSLRELRLWHWRKVLAHRHNANLYEAETIRWEKANPGHTNRFRRSKARQEHSRADWHLSAVVLLNEVVTGIAEEDDKRKPYV